MIVIIEIWVALCLYSVLAATVVAAVEDLARWWIGR